jgi:DNA-binding transcriptional LysR family regulator
MNFNQLRTFIAVAETLSFTKAAQELNFVQSVISSNIAELEKRLGVELFIRTNRSVQLTEIGEKLLENAYKIVSLVDDCYSICGRFNRGVTGNLNIGYVFSPTVRSVLDIIQEFSGKRPDVNLQLHAYLDNNLAQAAINNDADLLVTNFNSINRYLGKLMFRSIFKDKYQVVMSVRHPLASENIIQVKQLRQEKFCIMERMVNTGLYSDIITICNKANFAPQVAAESNAIQGLMIALEMNFGVTILPSSWRDHILFPERYAFIDLDGPDVCSDVGFAWRKENQNPTLHQFLEEAHLLLKK